MKTPKERKIKYEIVSIDESTSKYNFISVLFSWKKWSWKKFKMISDMKQCIYFIEKNQDGSNKHRNWYTGDVASEDFKSMFGEKHSLEFARWLHGEIAYRSWFPSSNKNKIEKLSETLIGKVAKVKKDCIVIDIYGKQHKLQKEECVTVVEILEVSTETGNSLAYSLLHNNQNIYLYKLLSEKFSVL